MGDGEAPPPLRVGVLGPLRLVVEGTAVEVRGPKRRAVLALLALAEGRTVTLDHLVDALWPGEPPDSGRQAVHTHVSRLRTHLGPAAARLQTRQDGYRLALDPDDLDLVRARSLLAAARATADAAAAYALLEEARGLWQGPVLADLTDVEPVATAVEACAQLRREVTDALVDRAVAAGRAGAVAALSAEELAADPLREPAVLLRMRVLAATGHAADALRVAREYRHRLAEETGLDPSPALGELERDVAGGAAGPAPVRPDRQAPAGGQAATRLVGREAQVAALHRLLADERLVTLVGPGGVGKTRVALEVARGGDALVLLLAPVTDPAAIPHALAAALGLTVVRGDVLTACTAFLGDRPALLVVDNCEHLLDGARATVATLLAACPRLTVLATSREPLGLAAEYSYRLAPLPLPGPAGDLARVPSVAVFLDRAARVRPGPPPTPEQLAVVADIVARLDGMPLAIELAAGRLSSFSLTDLRDRLDRSLDLLGGRAGSDHRHRTLRATVEWSYQLLTEDEQRLYRHLSVFVDGIDLATAERLAADLGVAGDPGSVLARLVDTSMVDVEFGDSGTRYRMLETLRAFGLDRLSAAGEREEATGRLVAWAVHLATWLDATVVTEREAEADAVLRRELANLRAAWRAARAQPTVDAAATIAVGLHDVCQWRDLTETWSWPEELADDPALDGHPLAADVLGAAAEFAYLRGDYPRSARLARAGLSVAADTDGTGRWRCLAQLATAELALGAWADAVEHAEAATALGHRPALPLAIVGLVHAYAGDLPRAREAHARMRAATRSPGQRGYAAYVAGEIENAAGDVDRALRHYAEAIALTRSTGSTFPVALASVGMVTAQARAGRVAEALHGYRDVVEYFARTGNWTHLWVTLRNLALLLRELGDAGPADLLEAAADAAPDAPAVDGRLPAPPGPTGPDRAEVLATARHAIARHLAAAPSSAHPR